LKALRQPRSTTWFGQENAYDHRGSEKKADVIEKLPHGNTTDRRSSYVKRRMTESIRAGTALDD